MDAGQIVTAVYDYIRMADEKYWLVQSGDQWGYIDQDGNEMGFFQDASDFSDGYALIEEDGEIWLIDEEFNRLQDLGQRESGKIQWTCMCGCSTISVLNKVKNGQLRFVIQKGIGAVAEIEEAYQHD